MRRSERMVRVARAWACAIPFCLCGAVAVAQPQRVVSINLCTDQLALMLAAPGQLVSVSRLAHDPAMSPMVDRARAVPTNGSGAEEIYLLAPDLVLAGTFTAPATVDMLRGLGIDVVLFAPAQSLADIPAQIARMGAVLGRDDAATSVINSFEADLAALSDAPAEGRLRAALSYVNNYSAGDATLAGDILRTAGFDNAATEVGLSSDGVLTLEDLIMLAPDVIIQGRDYPGSARAEDNLNHPALRALDQTWVVGNLTNRDWICGTPTVLEAVATLRALRVEMEAAR